MKANRQTRSICGLHFLVTVLAVWIGLAPTAVAQGYVFGRADYPIGSVTSLVAGDFNGDGKLDLAAVGSNGLSILIAKPDRTFLPAVMYEVNGDPVSIVAVDLNGDGKLDLAVATTTGVSTYLGNADGTFQAHVDYAAGSVPTAVATGDFNGDGKPDLAVTNDSDGTVSIFLNRGDGTFGPQKTYSTPGGPNALTVGDFNRDGKLDLAVASGACVFTPGCTYTVGILLGAGDGTFPTHTDYAANPEYFTPYSITTGDFNSDGKLDLAVGSSSDPPNVFGTIEGAGAVTIFLGNGDGTFQPGVDSPNPESPDSLGGDFRRGGASYVLAGDFNGDGIVDLAGSRFLFCDLTFNVGTCGHGYTIWLGKGDGTFPTPVSYPSDITGPLAAGDFNGDGTLDLAIGTKLGISVLLGQGKGAFPRHIDYATPNTAASGVTSDFNDDGIPDIAVTNGNQVSVFLGKGDGTFQPETDFAISQPGVNSAIFVVPADFNADGEMDLAISTQSSVSILYGRGDGTFRPHVDYPVPSTPLAIVSGNFNGDGRPDLAVSTSSGISILLVKTDGTFQPPTAISPLVGPLVVDDFNHDGKADLAVGTNNGVSVLLGNGNGTFQPTVNYASSGGLVATGDFNGDGKIDLVTVTAPGSGTGGYSVLLGNGDGTFQHRLDGPSTTLKLTLAVADMNHDGKADLLLMNDQLSFNFISILFGNGDGTFQLSLGGYDVGFQGGSTVIPSLMPLVADFNMDGELDWAEADQSLTVYLSTPAPPPTSSVTASVSPSTITFGIHDLDTISTKTATLTNTGTLPLTIANVTVTGGGDFAQTNNCGMSLAPGANCTFQIQFDPTVSGVRTATLNVTDNAADSPQTVALSGTGGPAPTIEPLSENFGSFVVGTTGGPRTVQVTNTTASTLHFTGITITGDFQQTNSCTGDLALKASCSIKVVFKPTAVGSRTGTLTITHNAATSPQTVPLSGTGLLPQTASFSPSTVVFATHDIGSTSAPKGLTLTNPGARLLTITNVTVTGDFSQTNDCGTSLAPGANCTFSIQFSPTAAGTRTGMLTVTDNAANSPQTIGLSGTGGATAGPTATPTFIVFAGHPVGSTSGPRTVQVTNSTASALRITNISTTGDFAQTNNCTGSLAVTARCVIQVVFKPTAGGSRTGSLSITDSAANSPQTVALSGTGTAPPKASISPATVVFAAHDIGSTSGPRTVNFTNSGFLPMTITNVSTTGEFQQTNNCPSALAPAASCVIQVVFTPTGAGTRAGSLIFTDNAPGSPQTAALTGTGATAPPSVTPTSIAFASHDLGIISGGRTVQITNSTASVLHFTSITTTGDFSQTNNCGASLAPAASCQIGIQFTPTAPGTRTGSLTIIDDGPGSPRHVALSGTGVSVVTLKPGFINFAAHDDLTTSGPRTATLTNSTTNPLVFSSITTTGDFSQTNNCGVSLAPFATCTFQIRFSPTQPGGQTGSFTITDNGSGSPRTITLSGSGVVFFGSKLEPTSIVFATHKVGTTSGPRTLTVTNTGNRDLFFDPFLTSGDFSQTNNCGASIPPSASCTIQVEFHPTATGTRTGTLLEFDSAGPERVVQLSGTGAP